MTERTAEPIPTEPTIPAVEILTAEAALYLARQAIPTMARQHAALEVRGEITHNQAERYKDMLAMDEDTTRRQLEQAQRAGKGKKTWLDRLGFRK